MLVKLEITSRRNIYSYSETFDEEFHIPGITKHRATEKFHG